MGAGGRKWYWHRVVAWAFSNPRRLTWATYWGKRAHGQVKYQAGHLSMDELDCRVSNLRVMTRRQNLDMYRQVAKAKHSLVYRG